MRSVIREGECDQMSKQLRRWLFPELTLFESDSERDSAWKKSFPGKLGYLLMVVVMLSVEGIMLVLRRASSAHFPELASSYASKMVALGVGASLGGLATLVIMGSMIRRNLRTQLVKHNVKICVECGYDLRSLTEPRCPECGTPFEMSSKSEAGSSKAETSQQDATP